MNDYELEIPTAICPQCGAVYDDYDGRGVVECDECGYCAHPVIYRGRCVACGHQLTKEELEQIDRG